MFGLKKISIAGEQNVKTSTWWNNIKKSYQEY